MAGTFWSSLSASVNAVPTTSEFRLLQVLNYRPRSRTDNTFGSVRVSVRLSVGALLFEPFDLDFWHEGRPCPWLAWDYRSRS